MSFSLDDFCQIFVTRSKILSLIIFILLGILLEYVIHYSLKISYVYTHLFYLIILLAAIWYKRYAVYLALFFGILHLVVYYFNVGTLTTEPVFRAVMLCIIALIAGSVVECMTHFRDELALQNKELERTKEAFRIANKKLNLLSTITRHDIINHLTSLMGYMDISEDMTDDPAHRELIRKEQMIADEIRRQLEFTRYYQDIGIREPIWHSLQGQFEEIQKTFHSETIRLSDLMEPVQVYADPLFPLICQNLIDNSIRHGGELHEIRFSTRREDGYLIVVYEDDGCGVPVHEKEKIFERGYGKHTGLGLFLAREILSITGLSIHETGIPGKGARFEITVPPDRYRSE
ncbi:MAG TPA: HAMP domain-containing sensor histidine kinase [Methanospirillum sp.]|uniref:sensor histidine kinase n=2 Tax=Methanospirillum sp. TaxID=45200 RepID=UPI002C14D775|nr:HAMP domain-containing sensor histidine kinase [Methanospirillum sp.]HOJ97469.1 HAMP domain-containing sensor histidine kinase [Methanospirillum sp.]